MPSYEEFCEHILERARAHEASGTDWSPILLMERYDDLDVVPLADFAHSRELWKLAMQDLLPKLIVTRGARYYGLINQQWMAKRGMDELATAARERASQAEDRYEALLVQAASAIEHRSWWALIERSDAGPTLGPWEEFDGLGGPDVEPLRQAIKLAGSQN